MPPTGKAHLKRAIIGQEEALRIQGLCRHLRRLDVLNDILQASHKRSLAKFEQYDKEDEFTDYLEAPDIICELQCRGRKRDRPELNTQ